MLERDIGLFSGPLPEDGDACAASDAADPGLHDVCRTPRGHDAAGCERGHAEGVAQGGEVALNLGEHLLIFAPGQDGPGRIHERLADAPDGCEGVLVARLGLGQERGVDRGRGGVRPVNAHGPGVREHGVARLDKRPGEVVQGVGEILGALCGLDLPQGGQLRGRGPAPARLGKFALLGDLQGDSPGRLGLPLGVEHARGHGRVPFARAQLHLAGILRGRFPGLYGR